MQRIGIIGGSFNPIHVAHVVIANQFANQLQLDLCYFIPAYQSPFKAEEATAANCEHRAVMVALAIEDYPKYKLSRIEIDRAEVSYTIDTVASIKSSHPNAQLFLLIGTDQAVVFDRWKDWQQICRLSQLCIVRRPCPTTAQSDDEITKHLTIDGVAPLWIDSPLSTISSTDVRQRIKAGESTVHLLDERVAVYIAQHNLYK